MILFRRLLAVIVPLSVASAATALPPESHMEDRSGQDRYYYLGRSGGPIPLKRLNLEIEQNPEKIEWYIYRGHSYLGEGDCKKALADFNRALKVDPKSGAAHIGKARAYECARSYDRALAELQIAADCGPERVTTGAIWESTFLRRELKQYGAAEAGFALLFKRKLTTLERAYALTQYAEMHQRTGQLERSLKDVNEAIRLDAVSPFAYLVRANTLNALKKYPEALSSVNSAIAVESKKHKDYGNIFSNRLSDAYRLRAQIYRATGKPDLAKQDEERTQSGMQEVFDLIPFQAR